MTSTQQLFVGWKGSQLTLKSQWIKANNDVGRSVKVSMCTATPKARYLGICYTAPKTGWSKATTGCRAHVRAIGDTVDNVEITSIDLNHTCDCNQNVQRKRNYRTSDITKMSEVVELWQPTATKEGNMRQFVRMTKAATGVSVKKGQAILAIREKSQDTYEAQIGQYMLLPSLFQQYKLSNPAGTYLLEHSQCLWERGIKQFCRCYVSLSFTKTFWVTTNMTMIICDGTFTKCKLYKHIVLIAVTFDGNNQVSILAFAVVDCENADNWTWFKERLEEDYPGIRVWMSDADKGIYSNQFSMSLSQSTEDIVLSRCLRHLAENCSKTCKTMNESQKRLVNNLA
jgi:MULE transposase domain